MAVSRFIYTEEMIEYVKEIAPGRLNKEITELFNKQFGLDKTVTQISSMKRNHGITSGNPKPKGIKLFTEEQEKFIKDNVKGTYDKDMANMVNEKFGTSYTVSQIKSLKARRKWKSGTPTKFTKGRKPWNKGLKGLNLGGEAGWFKKGQVPDNYKPVGSERVDSKDGYIVVKVQDDGEWHERWRHKHVVVWEKHNGKVPDNHVIVMLDGDRTNCDIENLMMISRRTLSYLNRDIGLTNDAEENKTRIKLAELESLISELKLTGGDKEHFEKCAKLAEVKGIGHQNFVARLKRGWSIEEASSLPLNSRRHNDVSKHKNKVCNKQMA